ncbi:RDD family protein [Actinoplanes sp. NPDC023714]|uniref:RDD family protein n=1 Tax=Actinoplanes sp. NPDC023714 TaxID=3154322 RepID=UPI0033E67EE3
MAASVNESPVTPAGIEPAGLGPRLAAIVIDWILCLLIASFYASPSEKAWPPVLVLVVANTFFLGLFGQTPGMRLARIHCTSYMGEASSRAGASYPDGGVIGLRRGLIRGVLLGLFIPAMIMDGQGRGLHDRAARSIVAKIPRS